MSSKCIAMCFSSFLLLFGCGSPTKPSNSDLSWKTYDPLSYPSLLVNKVDRGAINVYVVGEEDLLVQHIAESISKWTAPLPNGSIRTRFVSSLSDADLLVEVVPPIAGMRQFTTLMPYNRPVITLFENHSKTVLLHEMGHAMGLDDTYVAYHDGRTGNLTSTCDLYENQPLSIMCLGGNGEYRLYSDDMSWIRSLYASRQR